MGLIIPCAAVGRCKVLPATDFDSALIALWRKCGVTADRPERSSPPHRSSRRGVPIGRANRATAPFGAPEHAGRPQKRPSGGRRLLIVPLSLRDSVRPTPARRTRPRSMCPVHGALPTPLDLPAKRKGSP